MNITKERTDKRGKRIVTVELEAGEHIVAFNPNFHYRTGYPLEDVVGGHILLDSEHVTWCPIEQRWVA